MTRCTVHYLFATITNAAKEKAGFSSCGIDPLLSVAVAAVLVPATVVSLRDSAAVCELVSLLLLGPARGIS